MGAAKDERLAELASRFNVAQFVSFSAGAPPEVRTYRIRGLAAGHTFEDMRSAIAALMEQSSGSLNVRSFRPDRNKGNPFEYGITTVDEVVTTVSALAADGYVTIVNETIDTADGGVSGVVLGGVVEFMPGDTPRGVEKAGAASMPCKLGFDLLKTVYGFPPEISCADDERIEFSIHPSKVGFRRSHTLLWEAERGSSLRLEPMVYWPNRFSRFIGDKAFGLLVAHLLDLPVPQTTVIARGVAPFCFGHPTGTSEFWMRTCPTEQRPGKFVTTFGWEDPYALLARDDPNGTAIASVLAQESADPAFSGASLPGADAEEDFVEGVAGRGDEFMLGKQAPEPLPEYVISDVRQLAKRARQALGPVRLEFVHDGQRAWVVQLHLSAHHYRKGVISPGDPRHGWLEFDPATGLDELNDLIAQARQEQKGVRVIGPVGLTSHVGDLLRKALIPAQVSVTDGG